MFAFPLINLIFMVILYRVHKNIFYGTLAVEGIIYLGGVLYIEQSFVHAANQFLYYLALTGAGLIIVIAAFFIAISLNHRQLYSDHHE